MGQLPFIPGNVYRRRTDIHGKYGGNWQSGICPSREFPYIFIFTGISGAQHGYRDGWDNPNIYTYTGEGQRGDMEFTRGNLALRDHKENGKRVFLFESVRRGYVRFVCEVEVLDADFFETPDFLGNQRIGIKFFFKRMGVFIPYQPGLFDQPMQVAEAGGLYTAPNETERSGLITSRVGQGAYRKRIIHRWEYKCAVTAFDKLEVLIASHIVPWSESTDIERLDVNNGLLLSPTYDALFDRHLISFENDGKIILDNRIEPAAYERIGVTGNERISKLNTDTIHYLNRHRERFSEGFSKRTAG